MSKPECPDHPGAGYYIEPKGNHQGAYCNECDKWLKWVRKEGWKVKGLASYVLKSGKHKDKTIIDAVKADKQWGVSCKKYLENDFIREGVVQAMREVYGEEI